jgi:small-conductance mechanosensitive channel
MEKLSNIINYTFKIGDHMSFTPKAIIIVISVFILTSLLLKLFRKIIYKTLSKDAKVKFRSIFTFLNYFVYLIVVLITFDNIGINVTALFAASAALLVGVGLALQTFIQDIISGIFILADQAVHVGDIIEIDGQVGKVENIKLRTTRAVTRQNKVLIIPNHKFLTSILYNWTENGVITRENISIGVAYNSDVNIITDILVKIAERNKSVLKEPKPFVLFDDFGDSSLVFSLHFTLNESFSSNIVKSEIRYMIIEEFNKQNIEIPFPQRAITIMNSTKFN